MERVNKKRTSVNNIGCICCRLNLISGQNDINLGLFVISLSLFMIMNTTDKEIADQPRLNHFDLKSNLTCNIPVYKRLWL